LVRPDLFHPIDPVKTIIPQAKIDAMERLPKQMCMRTGGDNSQARCTAAGQPPDRRAKAT